MSEQIGEKTEQPTARHLEEALKKGQIARSREVQTVFVLMAGLLALEVHRRGNLAADGPNPGFQPSAICTTPR